MNRTVAPNLSKTYCSEIHSESIVTFELMGDLEVAREVLGNPRDFVYRWNSFGAFGIIEVRGNDELADPQTLRRVLQLLLSKTAALEQAKCRVVSIHYSFFSSWTHRSIWLSAEEIDAFARLNLPFTFSANIFRSHNYPNDEPQNFANLSYETSVSLDVVISESHFAEFEKLYGTKFLERKPEMATVTDKSLVHETRAESTTTTPVDFLTDYLKELAADMPAINAMTDPESNSLRLSCWTCFFGAFAQTTFPTDFFPFLKSLGIENFDISITLDDYYLPVETAEQDLWRDLK